MSSTFKVWIRYEQGENEFAQEIDVNSDWTVGDLRNKIFQATGFTFRDQIKIVFENRDISSDAKTLAMNGITHGAKLIVARGTQVPTQEEMVEVVADSELSPSASDVGTTAGGGGGGGGTVSFDRSHSVSVVEAATANDAFDTEKHHHRIVRRVMFSPVFTVLTLLLAIVSLVFFFVSLGTGELPWLQWLDFGVTIFFAIEVFLRIIVFPHFWRSWFNVFDVVLLVLCLVESIVDLAVELPHEVGIGMLAFRFVLRILRSIQLLRHQREYRKQQKAMQESIVDMNINFDNFDLKSFEQMEGDFVNVQL